MTLPSCVRPLLAHSEGRAPRNVPPRTLVSALSCSPLLAALAAHAPRQVGATGSVGFPLSLLLLACVCSVVASNRDLRTRVHACDGARCS